jgi:23S rRNA (uridine2552-2'-O)-methyltransferase
VQVPRRKPVPTRWYRERRQEGYHKMAKREGYRARSAYKLKQIQQRFRVLKRGAAVVDLGCAPGGWLQVLVELVGADGFVAGVDLQRVRPVPGTKVIQGDFTRRATRDRLADALAAAGRSDLDAVVSDMAPDMTGNYDVDQARSAHLSALALDFARAHLRPGGSFVCKVFEGEDYPAFREAVRASFSKVRPYNPPASRKQSSEVYLVGLGFKGRRDNGALPAAPGPQGFASTAPEVAAAPPVDTVGQAGGEEE